MNVFARAGRTLFLGFLLAPFGILAQTQTNVTVRIMAANLNGNAQSYQPFAVRIFQGLKPDIVAIQEFNYGNNTPADFRAMLDTAFGTNFVYFRESGYNIPNGIISRFPILASGSWDDPLVNDRGFAWVQIDLPGTNDLYVVSVHLYSSGSATDRNTEAATIKNHILTSFPANAWVVVAGDFNTDNRSEPAVTTFKTFLSDNPIPTDAESGGNPNTNEPRSKPYDYVLPSFSFTNSQVSAVFSSHIFLNGLVFDSRLYTPLSDVAPVQSTDSGNAQHMAVVKDFKITWWVTNSSSDAPLIIAQPQSRAAAVGSDATFTVSASGAAPLTYQWQFNGSSISGVTTNSYTRPNVQLSDAGSYSVIVTNSAGSLTSSAAILTVGISPAITTQPQSRTNDPGDTVTFTVAATGTPAPAYQWQFNGGNIPGASNSSYSITNVQSFNAGSYAVVLTNAIGSITSSTAVLTVIPPQGAAVIAQWNFNDTNASLSGPPPSSGSGFSSLLGGLTSAWVTGAATDTGSPNTAWNTTSYPSSTTGNKTAGVLFNVSTAGRQNISIRWDQRASSTGSKYMRLQYTTNGTFYDFPSGVSVGGTSFESKTNDLSFLPGANNNPNFAFRLVTEFESTATGSGSAAYAGASGTYASSGTIRFDMVTVSGSAIPAATPPGITTHPQSQMVNQGANVTFNVQATGSDPLAYQWRFNSVNLSGATASAYTRSNAQPAHMGTYSVLISNSAGSTNSSNAILTLFVPQPVLTTPTARLLQWQGLSNLTYTVQAKNNLNEPNWVSIGSASSPTPTISFTNQTGSTQEFYRVVYP